MLTSEYINNKCKNFSIHFLYNAFGNFVLIL